MTPSGEEPIAAGGGPFVMINRLQLRRLLLLLGLLTMAFGGLAYRLVDLQALRHVSLAALAQQNTEFQYFREPRRGDILDANGNLLATSIFVKTVCADPVLIGNQQALVAHALAPLLGVDEPELYQRLLPHLRRTENGETVTNRYVVLQHKVKDETWREVQLTMSRLSFGNEKQLTAGQRNYIRNLREHAIFTSPVDDQLRLYPDGSLAAHVLGFVSTDELPVDGQTVLETSGRDGIELTMNTALGGVPGWRVTEMDRRRQELVACRDQDVPPRDGYDVELTIDSVIQHIVETVLTNAMAKHTPISVTGIVIRPQTGEILALATLPDFDPNNPGGSPADARRDRVISDIMEPGSTFKIVVVSGALNEGVVQLSDTFDCGHGHFAYGGRILHDHEPYDILTTESIITKSSNIGAAKIGLRLGDKRLYQYARDFGIGQRTGIPLPGEVPGILHPVNDWSKVSIVQIPMGQGVAVTRLQMAMAMSAIANGGRLMQPMLIKRVTDRNGGLVAQYEPQIVRQIISPAAATLMVEALKTVPTPEGTAPEAALANYTVAGKTGTAQKAGPTGYLPGKYFASFIGFFPADNPQLCISVVMDQPKEGYYGGQVCGPIFREIAERCASYLNIPPDKNSPEPGSPPLVAGGVPKSLASARNP